MTNPVVTFFIPCYNVISCVERCINSMLHPDILDKIEILAINDGSKDDTSALLHQFESKYPDIIRVIDKENGGWGTAVNMAIKEARGKYFKEVDADDWVETDNLPTYLAKLEGLNVDYIATNYTEYWKQEDKMHPHTFHQEIYDNIYSIDDFWNQYPNAWDFPIHAITYRTQFIQDINLTVGKRYYGDLEYIMRTLPYVKSMIVIPINVTIYFRGSDEQSTSASGYKKHYRDFVELSQRMVRFWNEMPNVNDRLKLSLKNAIMGSVGRSYELMMSTEFAGNNSGIRQEIKVYDNWVKSNNKEFYDYCGALRKKGCPYIKIWRMFHINILKMRNII